METVLADPALYVHIGGEPPSLAELRSRYERQARGTSPDGSAGWLNWILRVRVDGQPAGFVQATITRDGADLAWLIAPAQQGKGLATEAARAVADWMRSLDIAPLSAHISPANTASEIVAERIGLRATDVTRAGETRWEG